MQIQISPGSETPASGTLLIKVVVKLICQPAALDGKCRSGAKADIAALEEFDLIRSRRVGQRDRYFPIQDCELARSLCLLIESIERLGVFELSVIATVTILVFRRNSVRCVVHAPTRDSEQDLLPTVLFGLDRR